MVIIEIVVQTELTIMILKSLKENCMQNYKKKDRTIGQILRHGA